MDNQPTLRLVHPTANLDRSIAFYRDGLGFDILDRYDNQNGWDGVIFGHVGWPYQIEISSKRSQTEVPRSTSVDSYIVFSIPEGDSWEGRLKALFDAGFSQMPVPPSPYGDGASAVFEDPDGYRVVLRRGRWKK